MMAGNEVLLHYLHGIAAGDPPSAAAAACRLARGAEYLGWPERAAVFDTYFWSEARKRLASEEVTAVVNRQRFAAPGLYALEAYVDHCRATVGATLVRLADPGRIEDVEAALTFRLSLDSTHQDRADDWLATTSGDVIAEGLADLPGYAFLIMTMSPSDSAQSFVARDAFWSAMLGRTV